MNRLTLTAPKVRTQVEKGLMEIVRRVPACEVLMAPAPPVSRTRPSWPT
jgi:hypothetical protein